MLSIRSLSLAVRPGLRISARAIRRRYQPSNKGKLSSWPVSMTALKLAGASVSAQPSALPQKSSIAFASSSKQARYFSMCRTGNCRTLTVSRAAIDQFDFEFDAAGNYRKVRCRTGRRGRRFTGPPAFIAAAGLADASESDLTIVASA